MWAFWVLSLRLGEFREASLLWMTASPASSHLARPLESSSSSQSLESCFLPYGLSPSECTGKTLVRLSDPRAPELPHKSLNPQTSDAYVCAQTHVRAHFKLRLDSKDFGSPRIHLQSKHEVSSTRQRIK